VADLKGKLVNPKDNKAVEEGLKQTVVKSAFDVGFENLTLPVNNETVFDDPPTQAQTIELQDSLNDTNAKINLVIETLKRLGINIKGTTTNNRT